MARRDDAKKGSATLKRYVYGKLKLVEDVNDANCKKLDVAIKTFSCKLTTKWRKCKKTKKKFEEFNKQWFLLFLCGSQKTII